MSEMRKKITKLSKAEKKRRRATADQRRVETIRNKYGPAFFSISGSKGGRNSPTKLTSETSKLANKIRWERHRAKQAKRRQKGEYE